MMQEIYTVRPVAAPLRHLSAQAVLSSPLTSVEGVKDVPSPASANRSSLRNLSTLVQTALISTNASEKSNAVWTIDYCKNFDEYPDQMRGIVDKISGDWSKVNRYIESRRAECQSLAAHDMVWSKQLATDAYKLGAVDGAYLHAKENGIPDDPAERKAWLEALKSAAYAGNGLSQSFVGAKVGAMFEDRDEAIGFRMLPLRSMENFANLPDHALYPLISLKPDYDKNSESVQRAVAVMNRLREAREQSKRK